MLPEARFPLFASCTSACPCPLPAPCLLLIPTSSNCPGLFSWCHLLHFRAHWGYSTDILRFRFSLWTFIARSAVHLLAPLFHVLSPRVCDAKLYLVRRCSFRRPLSKMTDGDLGSLPRGPFFFDPPPDKFLNCFFGASSKFIYKQRLPPFMSSLSPAATDAMRCRTNC